MIAFLMGLTLRQQVFRKSTLLLLGLAMLPALVALLFRLTDSDEDPQRWTAEVLYRGLIVAALLPLTALIYGTSVIGDEMEDGTAVYLFTKPIPRWQMLVAKVLAPWLLTSALTIASAMAAGLIAIDSGGYDIVFGVAAGLMLGALAYTLLFVLLSIVTSHALMAGLVYVFLWEGVVTAIFEGTRYESIRHATLGISDWAAGSVPGTFDAYVGGETALIIIAMVIGVSTLLANRRLERVEIRERA